MNRLFDAWHQFANDLDSWWHQLLLNLPIYLLAVLIMLIGIFLSRRLRRVVKRLIYRFTKEQTVIDLFSNLTTILVLICFLLLILNILNLDKAITSLLAGAGVMGLIVGLALQDPLVNLFSGAYMAVRNYYQIGDLVRTNGFLGKIKEINLRSTILYTPSGQDVILPNKSVLQAPLTNFTINQKRRIEIQCSVAYQEHLEQVEKVAIEAIENTFDLDLPVKFYYTQFGESSIHFMIHFWQQLEKQKDYFECIHLGIKAIKQAFETAGISIPYPIRTIEITPDYQSSLNYINQN